MSTDPKKNTPTHASHEKIQTGTVKETKKEPRNMAANPDHGSDSEQFNTDIHDQEGSQKPASMHAPKPEENPASAEITEDKEITNSDTEQQSLKKTLEN